MNRKTLFGMGLILAVILVSGCVLPEGELLKFDNDTQQDLDLIFLNESDELEDTGLGWVSFYKLYDKGEGIVCYLARSSYQLHGMSCLYLKEKE